MQSVFEQTWQEFEYIIIDGGSTDGSKEYLEEHNESLDYWVSEPDKGIYNAMNKGIKAASGEYLLFLNSGDELHNPGVLQENIGLIHTEDLIYFDINLVFSDRTVIHRYPGKLNYEVFRKGAIGHPTTFIRRQLFSAVGLYDESLKIVSDWKFFFLASVKYNCSRRKIDKTLSTFYMDGVSSTQIDLVRKERRFVIKNNFEYEEKIFLLKRSFLREKNHLSLKFKIFLRPLKRIVSTSFDLPKRKWRYISREVFIKAKVYYFRIFKRSLTVNKNDIRTFPIIIISYNQLFYLEKLINTLKNWGYRNIIIIDNASTYQPLLKYLKKIEDEVTIYRLKRNYGHRVFWHKKEFFLLYGQNYYVVTDPDVVPVDSCPEDFLEYFKRLLEKNSDVTKVGFSLKLDDIPLSNPHKSKIIGWEKKFWQNINEDGNYRAEIDTTFALYRPKFYPKERNEFFRAIRTKSPYLARHGGWYIDVKALTEEQKNYIESANNSSSWLINKKGDLKNSQYK